MYSEGVLQTVQGNDWDWYSSAKNPNWPSGQMTELNGESCFQLNLKMVPVIQLLSQFEIKGTVKAVISALAATLVRLTS